ncbi:UDP-glucose dehydrogenase family protein [Niallia endozanthoxylica]|uniref:UDP-glucose 6-dehydrogenase n=1 Tax=Niallia endozanthoxylica TaxID=2036016 RepID=A0A5J5HP90_9BACI|nr:UDP-glucose/GDP-mannose dehydrogenase family protein [Niallia endozanthoxylica]KAA9021648.1 UDP-glucose/GDP-mannose dehydrogenase family protein [Niallia endozanthoxylica]
MRITVAGIGYVGLVTAVCLADLDHEVTCVDLNKSKIDMLQTGRSPIYEPDLEHLLEKNISYGRLFFTTNPKTAYKEADLIFITVGTPANKDGTVDLRYITVVAETIAQQITNDVIICTKSTVPVGTNEKIKQIIDNLKAGPFITTVISNPEFLREGSAVFDFFYGDRIVIGSDNPEASETMEKLYAPLHIPVIKTDIRSAEMIKYASNAFLATKISFINEIAAICEKLDANIDEVAVGIGSDKRIGNHFLRAGIGYGGSCFPKDTKALAQLAGNVQHSFELLDAVIKVNNRQQSLPIKKAKEVIPSLAGKKVSVLGLAFKPGTDDIRESASLKIMKELLQEKALITAYDPVAVPNMQKELGNNLSYTNDICEALWKSELAIISTEWEQIKQFPLSLYVKYMKDPVIIDGRNCYSMDEVKKHSIHYISIGRPTHIPETVHFNL